MTTKTVRELTLGPTKTSTLAIGSKANKKEKVLLSLPPVTFIRAVGATTTSMARVPMFGPVATNTRAISG